MTNSQIERLLALPLEARRRLAEQSGPGWWVTSQGMKAIPMERPPFAIQDKGGAPDRDGFRSLITTAWAPADSVAWMLAASQDGHYSIDQDESVIGEIIRANPIDCALAALKERYDG